MRITVEHVEKLGYEAISCEPIRQAAAAFSAAKVAAEEARKTHVQLGQELPNAQQEDAREDERLRAEGKPKLKGRPATLAAEKGIADAEHELRVCRLAAERVQGELEAAIDEHGQTWADEVARDAEALCAEWQTAANGLVAVYSRLAAAAAVSRVVGGHVPAIGALRFPARAIHELEIAGGQHDPHGVIQTGEALARLAELLVEPEPAPEPERQPTRSTPPVGEAQEQAERRRFMEQRTADRRRQLAESEPVA
jgi:hypothetical protein